jgi:hypothetical protein
VKVAELGWYKPDERFHYQCVLPDMPVSPEKKQPRAVSRNLISPFNDRSPTAKIMGVREATNGIRY